MSEIVCVLVMPACSSWSYSMLITARHFALSFAALLLAFVPAVRTDGQTGNMPRLDASRFASPSFYDGPILVENGDCCFDVNYRYLAVTSLVDYKPVVVIFDLTDGSRLKEFPMEGNRRSEVLSVSPDLTRMIYREEKLGDIQLFDITGDSPELVDEVPFSFPMTDGYSGLHYFASQDRFISANTVQNTLKIWNGLDGNRVHTHDGRFNGTWQNVTPDRQFVYHGVADAPTGTNHNDGREITYISLATGRIAGKVKLDTSNSNCRKPLLSPDGTKMICITERARPEYTLAGFDAQNGQRQFEFEVPGDALYGWSSGISWLGNDYFIVGNVLCSFRQQKILLRISNLKPAGHCAQTGHTFFRERYDGQWILTHRKIADELAAEIATVDSATETRLENGGAVGVQINLRTNAPIRNFERQFQSGIENGLTSSGYRIQANAPVTLTATIVEEPTGQIVDYSSGSLVFGDRFLQDGDVQAVREIRLKCTFEFSDRDGVFHEQEIEWASPNEVIEWERNDTVQDAVKKWRWKSLFEYPGRMRFSHNYVTFNIKEYEIDAAPDAEWLAAIVAERRSVAEAVRSAAEADRRMARDRENFELRSGYSGTVAMPDSRFSPDWNVDLFAMPRFDNSIMRSPLKVGGVNSPACEVMDVQFATLNTAQAAVLLRDSSTDEWFVDRYDLEERRHIARTPVDPESKLLDFRPDGKVWAIAQREDADEIYIYQTATETGRDIPDNKIVELDHTAGKSLYAGFAGTSSILIFEGSKLQGVELPDGNVIFEAEYPESTSLDRNPGPVMSFDRQFFLFVNDQRCELRRTSDGSVAGEFKHDLNQLSSISDAAFRTDGSQLALLSNSGICVIDLTTGTPARHVAFDRLEGPIRWIDEGTILAKNELVDLDLGAVVWTYGRSYGDMVFMYSSPDNGWYVGRNDRGVNYLVRNAVPSGDVNSMVTRLHSTAPVALDSGARVSLELDVSDSFSSQFEAELAGALTSSLEASGYEVVASSDVVIRADATLGTTRNNRELGFDSGSKFFMVRDQLFSVKLYIEQGDTSKRIRSTGFLVSSADYQVNWDAADPEADLMQQLETELIRRVFEVPIAVKFAAKSDLELGRSEFEDGVEELKLNSFGRETSGE
ncbi:MAG: WD40 repeat domain-containing protein [Planctomycetota bacterium]